MVHYPGVTTKLVILLGNPLGHSVSPAMHNRVFDKLGMDYCYMPVEVTKKNLKRVFSGLKAMNVAGFNVTIPHKIAIMEYLDELDPLAATIGAVNTICVNSDGKTTGYNTDGEGFMRSLEDEAKISVTGKRVFLLGCGGGARAIAMTLAFHGAEKIYLHNRTVAKAEGLSEEINDKIRPCTEVVTSLKDQKEALENCSILINSTSLGMHPHDDVLPIDESLISPHLIVADIVYNPLMTKLLRTARDKGCAIVPGLGMLIYQGAAAFKLFTDVEPLVEEMSEVAYALMS